MSLAVGVVMDPLTNIHFKKDTTLALLLEAKRRGHELTYFEQKHLYVSEGRALAFGQKLSVFDDEKHYFELHQGEHDVDLGDLDVILMRKDPPFDMEYIYTTYILEIAERTGKVLIVNKPQALRDANEKMFAQWFPQCMPDTLVTRDSHKIRAYIERHQDVVLKPLHSMGGGSIFRIQSGEVNTNVIIETLTANQTQYIMVQRFIPEISAGDKRILVLNGEPIDYALARIPKKGEIRGNLAAGGHGEGVLLTKRDRWICEQIGPTLKQKGLIFVGLDVIGDYLTEINVTSPTCLREIETIFNADVKAQFWDCIEGLLREDVS